MRTAVLLAVAAVVAAGVVAVAPSTAEFAATPAPEPAAALTLTPTPTPTPTPTAALSLVDRSLEPAGDRNVFVVGDSLTVGTEPWLASALASHGWRLAGVDARVGRPVGEGLVVLRDRAGAGAGAGSLPGTVIVALGTNDLSASPGEIADWLAATRRIAGTRRVIWIDLCLDDHVAPRLARFRDVNAALATGGGAAGVEVADWCAFSQARSLRPGRDGIHYDTAAYQVRAEFYAEALDGDAGLPVTGRPAPS